jgi:serine/threonine protein kinase
MLQLAIATRKDTAKYDRRKQVGTNNLTDVWGLGCLFYELLTGEILFQVEDYFEFHMRLT